MRKQRSPINHRKPEIEALEDRNLLSSGIAQFEVSPPLPRTSAFVPLRPPGLGLFPDGPSRALLAENSPVPALHALETGPGFGPAHGFPVLSQHALLQEPSPPPPLVDLAIFAVSEHGARHSDLGPAGPPAVTASQDSIFSPPATLVIPLALATPFPSGQNLAFRSAFDLIHHRPDPDPMHARDSGARLSSDSSMPDLNAGTDQTPGIAAFPGVLAGAEAVLGSASGGSVAITVTSLPTRVTSFSDAESIHGSATEYVALTRENLPKLSQDSSPVPISKTAGPGLLSLGATARTAILKGRLSANLTSHPADLHPADLPTAPDSQEIPALPHAAGLIAEAFPQDGRSLQEAIDQFLDRLPELELGQVNNAAPGRVVPCSLALFGALVAAYAVRRRLRVKGAVTLVSPQPESRENDELMGFPELPGSWSTRVT